MEKEIRAKIEKILENNSAEEIIQNLKSGGAEIYGSDADRIDGLKIGKGKHPVIETLMHPIMGTAFGYGMGFGLPYLLFGDAELSKGLGAVVAGAGFIFGLINASSTSIDEKRYKSNLNYLRHEIEKYASHLLK